MGNLRYIVLFCIFAANGAFSQQASYRLYRGTIDRHPVTFHLNRTRDHYFGYFYYDLNQVPVYVTGEDTSRTGNFSLSSFLPPDRIENFSLRLEGRMIKGSMQEGDSSSPLAVFAEEDSTSRLFELVFTYGSSKLRPSLSGSPQATFEAACVWPRPGVPHANVIKKVLNELFDSNNASEDIGQLFLRRKKNYFTGYREESKGLPDSEIKEHLDYDYSQLDEACIVFRSSKLLTLARFSSSYTGGAHENYWTAFVSVDLVHGRKLKLDDVLTVQGQKRLASLLEMQFRKSYSLKDTESLMDAGLSHSKIEPNPNFYITEKGIGFDYTPYEIGPFAMGEINLFIPFTELKDDLKPGLREILN